MILITGGTGFIGNVLIRHLSNLGYPIKLLIRPSKQSPNIPKGIPLDVAITSLTDTKGLRAAMKGVDVIYHLASAESLGREAQLSSVDIQGTQAIVEAAPKRKLSVLFIKSPRCGPFFCLPPVESQSDRRTCHQIITDPLHHFPFSYGIR
jgi:nucleoside-diphosphate-sugar epimerase